MTGMRQSPTLRRVSAYRLVLGVVALTTVIAAAAVAALASFAGQGLAQAVHRQLASADTSITITAQADSGSARADTAAVQSRLRAAFGAVPLTLDSCLWSNYLALPTAPGTRLPTVPGTQPDPLILAGAARRRRGMGG